MLTPLYPATPPSKFLDQHLDIHTVSTHRVFIAPMIAPILKARTTELCNRQKGNINLWFNVHQVCVVLAWFPFFGFVSTNTT